MKNKKNKMKLSLFLICITVCLIFSGIYGCGVGTKYFLELKASYQYDKNTGVLVKFPSEVTWEPEEILSYSSADKKTQILEYEVFDLTLPKRNYYTGEIENYKTVVAYTVYNDKLVFAEVPIQYAPHEYYIINNSVDSVIVTIDNENAFLVNLKDASFKKLFNDSDIDNFFGKGGSSKLIYAKTISISPDGKYILYLSNRDYIQEVTSHSVDIYVYDIQTGSEKKIMNFDNRDFLCWEKDSTDRSGNSGNFLFRESKVSSRDGIKFYSDIFRYSITNSKDDLFFPIEYDYNNYEMIGDQYIYSVSSEFADGQRIKKNTVISLIDIYSNEIKSVNIGKYSVVWNLRISESGNYLALFGSYLNPQSIAIPEVITVNIETSNIRAHYEQSEGKYFLDTFFWCPDDVLSINFLNTYDVYKDLCRFISINH